MKTLSHFDNIKNTDHCFAIELAVCTSYFVTKLDVFKRYIGNSLAVRKGSPLDFLDSDDFQLPFSKGVLS